jgi:hypothetical protein
VLVVALVGAGFSRNLAWKLRATQTPSETRSSTSLSSMNSFALALLLGGLRGPLVMVLWTSSESQKTEKNLEDFDTKVEWIRLLQPEFDTVHIFQIWNKAYNVSVQMANLPNKYTTILDALEYARGVDAERPQNINILQAIGGIYADKLGASAEKKYYRQRVREETQPHTARQKLVRGDPGWRPLEHEPILDAKGNILPDLLKTIYPRPADLAADAEWNSGAELQYLEKYQPFELSSGDFVGGVSPIALGYNYFKRSQVLQGPPYNQRHAQLSDMVIDSRPALALRDWAEEERQRARAMEARVFDKPYNEEMVQNELPTANVRPIPPADPSMFPDMQHAISCYERSVRIGQDSLTEYERHVTKYTANLSTYEQHIQHIGAMRALSAGDAAYLRAALTSGDERAKLLRESLGHYQKAAQDAQLMILKYYVSEELVPHTYPNGSDKTTIAKQPPELYGETLMRVLQMVPLLQFDGYEEDRTEYLRYVQRCAARSQQIELALKQGK